MSGEWGWGGRKDDGALAGKPKKIRSAAVDGGEETEESEEALTDVKETLLIAAGWPAQEEVKNERPAPGGLRLSKRAPRSRQRRVNPPHPIPPPPNNRHLRPVRAER